MKRNHIKPSVLAASFAYMLAGFSPVLMADDTEIFFGGTTSSGTNNVLFILDTSGSMATDDEGNGTSRMDDLKEAFKSLLSQVNGVNVGVMRFSNPGGPVLYPISYIDEELVTGVTTGSVEVSISNASNDGYQMVGSGAIYLGTTQLELGANAIAGVTYQQRNVRIDNGNDDAESTSATAYTLNGGSIDTPTQDGSTAQINGFRFRSANIPAGATVTGAYLEAEVRSVGPNSGATGTWQVSVTGDLVDGATDFNAGNRHPWYRYYNKPLTSAVDWTISPPMPAVDDRIRTPDISNIIQQIVNASGASTTSVVSLLLGQKTGTTFNRRIGFKSREDNTNARARLVVDYYTGTPVTGSVLTALRFENVRVPLGAAITSASLEFKAATTSSTSTDLTIMAEKAGNSAALTTTAFDVSGRSMTSATVPWSIPGWTADTAYTTPDLSGVVQEVVDISSNPTWCGGNAMTFVLRGDAGRQLAKAYESGSANAPVLRIAYDTSAVVPGTSCSGESVSIQVSSGSDDAEQLNSTVSLSDNTIDLVANSSVAQQVGFRFRNVTIPKGSTISSAYLQVQATEDDSGSVSYQIYGQDVDNAGAFSSTSNNISGRPKTGASVAWSVSANWVDQTNYQSPDIASVIQPIIDRSGWISGNSLALIITGTNTSTDRRIYSRDASGSRAARLTINYIDKGQSKTQTVRDRLITITDNLNASGNTPIQDVMYEAALYYRGENVDYGKRRGNGYSYTRVSTPESLVPSTYSGTNKTGNSCLDSSASSCADEELLGTPQYKSPITESCQKNYIVLLTDGRPNSPHSQAKISNMVGSCTDNLDPDEACVTDLARWLNDPEGDQSSVVDDNQTVTTHTIGFNIADNWLKEIADAGGGNYYEANDAASLATAFEKIIGTALDATSSFVAAGTSVNAFNRSQNRDDLYFAVFKPDTRPKWPGNLKKYRIDIDTLEIRGANNANAINASGQFSDTSRSFWSSSVDGADVEKGGAGGMITNYATRNLYTYLGVNSNLAAAANELVSTNANLTAAMFNEPTFTATQLVDLIDWTRGKDVLNEDNDTATDTRFVFADPLHSRPVAVTYGGDETNPDITIFISTNSGFLHAIDNDDGREVFGFIPQEFLAIQNDLKENSEGTPHPYGLDGALTSWVIDPENDGVVLEGGSLQTDNHVWLFASMRRGGRGLYALDVSTRSSPRIMWRINENTTGFSSLGQTWSQPVKGEINVGGVRTKVLVFGGGYDPNQDSTTNGRRETDGMGNAVYIVNAETGALLWSGSSSSATTTFTDMRYSIPSTVSAADVNGDGLLDFFFVGDMGGQVWRFDIRNGQSGASLVTGGVIADLGVADVTHNESSSSNTAVNNRRFYHSPALFIGLSGGSQFLGVAIGSGYRAHPLDTRTDDNFYMIRQSAIYSAPATYTKLTQANLFDATSNVIQEGTVADQTAALAQLSTQNGWFISMTNEDEKVLSTPLIVAGRIYFATYQPVASPEPCQPSTGTNRSYAMSVYDATAVVDFDNINGLSASDRSQEINVSGIVDQSATIYIGDQGVKIDGTHTESLPAGLFIDNKVYWHEYR